MAEMLSPHDGSDPMVDRAIAGTDSHGTAAVLLAESIIHSLIARSVISSNDAQEIVDIAIDVCADIADQDDNPAKYQSAMAILTNISLSLGHDI